MHRDVGCFPLDRERLLTLFVGMYRMHRDHEDLVLGKYKYILW
jgi:hypothetical protein